MISFTLAGTGHTGASTQSWYPVAQILCPLRTRRLSSPSVDFKGASVEISNPKQSNNQAGNRHEDTPY